MAYIYDYTPQIEAVQKQIDNYGQFRYGKENAYQKALAAVTNPTAFSYDVEQDPVYSAYRKQYLREGNRAMADTLAKASAATGGRPSSYAVTAAQQAGNYYNSQLTDVIPTLYQNAYQRYMNNIDLQKQALDVLAADRDAAKTEHQANYELLLEKLEELQALQEEQQSAQGGASPAGTFVAPGVMEDTSTGVTATSPGGTFTPVSTTPQVLSSVYKDVDTAATRSFKGSVMTRREFSRTGDKYASYEDYLAEMIDQRLSRGDLTDEEAATLMQYYGLV